MIHMNISETRSLVSRMTMYSDQMWSATLSLEKSAANISYAWQGTNAGNYLAQLRNRIQTLQSSIEQVEALARLLSNEIDEREQIDALGVANLQALTVNTLGVSAGVFSQLDLKAGEFSADASAFAGSGFEFAQGGLSIAGVGGLSLNLRGGSLEPFQWDEWGNSVIKDGLSDADEYAGGAFEWAAAGLGRAGLFSNTMFYRLSEQYNSVAFKNSAGLAADITSGLVDGESLSHAVVSGAIETGLTKGLTYLVPGVGTAFIVMDGIQLAGHITSGVMAGLGYEAEAQVLSNLLDTIDLSGYVGDFSDAVTDWMFNPSEPMDLSELGERATKFTCGLDVGLEMEFSSSLSIHAN